VISTQGKKQIRIDEGKRNRVYRDTRGIRTIGIGYNMDMVGSRATFMSVLDVDARAFEDTRDGLCSLSDAMIEKLFNFVVTDAYRSACFLIKDLQARPQIVQDVLTNLVYNMGWAKVSRFYKLLTALKARDYNKAADELVDSAWYDQVGERSKRIVEQIRSLSNLQVK
jgi:lysozyme